MMRKLPQSNKLDVSNPKVANGEVAPVEETALRSWFGHVTPGIRHSLNSGIIVTKPTRGWYK